VAPVGVVPSSAVGVKAVETVDVAMQASPSIVRAPTNDLIDQLRDPFPALLEVLARIDQIGTSLSLPTRRVPGGPGRGGVVALL
jgi:hypothetical protein